MKTTIDMARAAELNVGPAGMGQTVWGSDTNLKRFEALVRADQDEKYKWDIHSCGPTCKRYACVAMREAVDAEREACAKVCESLEEQCEKLLVPDEKWPTPADCASVIRARGQA
jgi:hypothetical protein